VKTIDNLRELDFLPELVDLLQVGHFVVGVDETDGDVSGDTAVAVDVRCRAVRRHRDARRLAQVRVPHVVVEHQALPIFGGSIIKIT